LRRVEHGAVFFFQKDGVRERARLRAQTRPFAPLCCRGRASYPTWLTSKVSLCSFDCYSTRFGVTSRLFSKRLLLAAPKKSTSLTAGASRSTQQKISAVLVFIFDPALSCDEMVRGEQRRPGQGLRPRVPASQHRA
jgi:hypothetical protein